MVPDKKKGACPFEHAPVVAPGEDPVIPRRCGGGPAKPRSDAPFEELVDVHDEVVVVQTTVGSGHTARNTGSCSGRSLRCWSR